MKRCFQYPNMDNGSFYLAQHLLFACSEIANRSISPCSSDFSISLFNYSQFIACKSMNFISFQTTDE